MVETRTLFTIGYEGRSVEEVIGALTGSGVTCLVDVRENPFSRKKGFSKKALSEACEAAGIRYVHMKELGTPRSIREKVKTTGDFSLVRGEVEAHLEQNIDRLRETSDLIDKEMVCLICYEAEYLRCHRSIVAEMLSGMYDRRMGVVNL